MKKLIWFGLSLVALSATPTFSTPSRPPVSCEEGTRFHSPSTPVLEQDSKTYYEGFFNQALRDPNGLSKLFLAYGTANANVKINMDQYLLLPILQSLEPDDARNTLTKLAPFFLKFFSGTQHGRKAIQKALQDLLDRELDKIQSPYNYIKHLPKEALKKGENELLGKKRICLEHIAEKNLKRQHEALRNAAKNHLPTLKSCCNHAYISDQDKIDQLAAIYRHLPWQKQRTFKKILRKSRHDEERALKNEIKGFIRMAK